MVNLTVTTVTQDVTLNALHHVLVVNAPDSAGITITLPDTGILSNGRNYVITRSDTQSAECFVVAGGTGQLVAGEASIQISQGDILDIVCWNNNWVRVSQ